MAMNKDMKAVAYLFLGLFVLAIITGVTFLGLGALKGTLCTQAASTHVYEDGVCEVSSTNTTAVTVDAITHVETLEAAIVLGVSLVSLIVLMIIFGIIIKAVVGFARSGKGSGF